MSDAGNPYLPPKAVVADPVAEAPTTRPMAINIALILIGVRLLWTSILLIMRMRRTSDIPIDSAILIAAMAAAITVPLAVGVARGRNWARIVYLILALFSLVSLTSSIVSMFDLPAGVSMRSGLSSWSMATIFLPSALSIAVVVLLFGPGREWFRARSK
jgi:hypothetical protein